MILKSQKHQLLRFQRVSPLWRQAFNPDNQMYISSQLKSALRKFSEGKDHDCDSFMSDVSVLYKSSVSRLAKWTTWFAECKMLWLDSSVCKQLIGKRMKYVTSICLIEMFLLMKLKWTVWPIPKLVRVRAKRASTKCILL